MALMLRSAPAVLPISHPCRRPGSLFIASPVPYPIKPFNPRLIRIIAAKQYRIAPVTAQSAQTPAHPSSLPATTDYGEGLLSSSTRTIATISSIAFSLFRLFLASPPTPPIRPNPGLIHSTGPLFFAAARVATPLTLVAAFLSRWLEIYNAILLVRVLLSWFPNVSWERQPLTAIRDLSDPYLSLFRNIIPPVFDALDISPVFAFIAMGAFAGILRVV